MLGPSASGKSSLVRAIVGVWPTLQGKIRIDSAAIDQWTPDALGPHIGYLPQDMELFGDTVAENIARFHPDATSQTVIAAARAAKQSQAPAARRAAPAAARKGPAVTGEPVGDRALRSPATAKRRASTRAAGARRQAKRDSR